MSRKPLGRQQSIGDIKSGLKESVPQVIAEIEQIGQAVNAERLFVAITANLMMSPPGEESRLVKYPSLVERLAYLIYPLFGGSNTVSPTSSDCQQCMDALEKLHAQETLLDRFPDETDDTVAGSDVAAIVRMHTNVVRGSAYPEQTETEIIAIQGQFEDWFTENVGIGPEKACTALWAIAAAQGQNASDISDDIRPRIMEMMSLWNDAAATLPKERTPEQQSLLTQFSTWEEGARRNYIEGMCETASDALPVSRESLSDEGVLLTPEEWEALLRLLGLTSQTRMGMLNSIDMREYPLYILPEGKVLLVDISHAMDILWERFEQIARNVQSFYDARYQVHKGEWLEQRTVECLSRVFPASSVYRSLTYPDPDRPAGATTELDIAVMWGPFLVLVEAKAKQFRLAFTTVHFLKRG